jgi:hypothetical protein
MCKKHELMKDQFLYDFHYQILGWEVVMNNPKSLGCMNIALDTMTHHVWHIMFVKFYLNNFLYFFHHNISQQQTLINSLITYSNVLFVFKT